MSMLRAPVLKSKALKPTLSQQASKAFEAPLEKSLNPKPQDDNQTALPKLYTLNSLKIP